MKWGGRGESRRVYSEMCRAGIFAEKKVFGGGGGKEKKKGGGGGEGGGGGGKQESVL